MSSAEVFLYSQTRGLCESDGSLIVLINRGNK